MNYFITSFNAGFLSPKIDSRSDTEKYSSGCRIIDNMIPTIYGGAERRPGTLYINSSKNPNEKVRLIGFIYSSEIAYQCEFGDQYIRFYYNGELLVSGGSPVEVVTPYLIADVPLIQVKQIGDVMRLVHPLYPTRTLSRTTPTAFSLDIIEFDGGPFLTRNDISNNDGITITPSVTEVDDTGTLTASSGIFESGHVDSIWAITQPRVNVETTVEQSGAGTTTSDELLVEGAWNFITRNTWIGTVKIERKDGDADWDTYRTYNSENDNNFSLAAVENGTNVKYRLTATLTGAGKVNADITLEESTQTGIVRITGYTSTILVDMIVLKELASTDATIRWAEGAWSEVRGYPRAVDSHSDRIVYGGSAEGLQTVWFSEVSNYDNFFEGTNDSDAFIQSPTTTNEIFWLASLNSLAIGTSGDEWQMSASDLYKPITPTDSSVRRQTNYGSAPIQPVRAGNAILFVDSVNRKLREMTYDNLAEKLTSPDLTAFADVITEGKIKSVAYQNNPNSIIWVTLEDGTLLSLTYERDQNVVAWASHPGINANYVSVIPGADEDEVWLSVNRTINGSNLTYIEQMQPRNFGLQEDAYFVDGGIKYDGVPTTTFTGLDHLEREEVSIYGDGAVIGSETVVGGSVTISNAVSKAMIGLGYEYKLEPMRIDIGQDTTKGKKKITSEIIVSFYNTFNALYGDDRDTYPFDDWRTDENYDNPPEMYTGDKRTSFRGGFDIETHLIISGSDPTPCTVRSIVAIITITENK